MFDFSYHLHIIWHWKIVVEGINKESGLVPISPSVCHWCNCNTCCLGVALIVQMLIYTQIIPPVENVYFIPVLEALMQKHIMSRCLYLKSSAAISGNLILCLSGVA